MRSAPTASRCSVSTPRDRSAAPRASWPAIWWRPGRHRRVLAVGVPEAVRGQRAVRARLRPGRLARGRRRLRALHAGLHPPQRGAARRRPDGGGQGPPQRAEEPLRPPATDRHQRREREGVAHDVGPGALPRVVPVLGRRLCRGLHRPGRAERTRPRPAARPAWVLGSAVRSEPTQFPGRDPVAPQGATDCAMDVYRQAGITRPREQIDCAEIYVPFSLVRAHVAGGPPLRRARRGLEDGRGRDDRAGRVVPGQHVGGSSLVEPDRCLGAVALRRGRAPGPGHGRRAPGRRRPCRVRPGLRGREPVLQHVGRRSRPRIRSHNSRWNSASSFRGTSRRTAARGIPVPSTRRSRGRFSWSRRRTGPASSTRGSPSTTSSTSTRTSRPTTSCWVTWPGRRSGSTSARGSSTRSHR